MWKEFLWKHKKKNTDEFKKKTTTIKKMRINCVYLEQIHDLIIMLKYKATKYYGERYLALIWIRFDGLFKSEIDKVVK